MRAGYLILGKIMKQLQYCTKRGLMESAKHTEDNKAYRKCKYL